jgi:cation transport ATPase
MDQSLVTGESLVVRKSVLDEIFWRTTSQAGEVEAIGSSHLHFK